MERYLLLFLLIITTTSCYGQMILTENKVTFNRQENGLAWPVPDVNNSGMLLIHGIHCYQMIQDVKNESDPMSNMHYAHCRGVVEQILAYLDKNPSYRVDTWICDTLLRNIVEKRSTQSGRQQMTMSSCSYSYYYYGYQESSPSACRKKRSMTRSQNGDYVGLAAKNFGELLMKNWTEPKSLALTEQAYLKKFASQEAVSIGAISVFCSAEGDKNIIRQILQEN